MEKTYSKILKIKKCGKSKVMDFTVKDTHRILANKFYTSHCSISHTYVADFISAKLDLNKVNGANISVKIDDEFMIALEKKQLYKQEFIFQDGTKIEKEIDPKELWDKLIYNAWKSAEPGILFWGNVEKYTPSECYPQFKAVTTNPCVIGDTLVLTNIGWIKIKNLNLYKEKYKDELKVITRNKEGGLFNSDLMWSGITNKDSELYKTEFDNHEYMITNNTHKFYDKEYNKIEIKDLKIGDSIIGGDNNLLKIINISKLDYKEDVYDLTAVPNYNFFSALNKEEFIIEEKINNNFYFNIINILSLDKSQIFACEYNTNNLQNIINTNIQYYLSSSLSVDCGEIPLNPYGSCRLITSNLYSYVKNPFGKDSYFDFNLFFENTIIAQRINDDLIDLEIEKVDKIIKKIQNDPEPESIKKTELNLWNNIKQDAINGRRTGLGIMGLADCLAALNIRYSSDESIVFIEKMIKEFIKASYKSSIIMAKERGSFIDFKLENEKDNVFLNRVLSLVFNDDKDIQKDYIEYGRRNIANGMISPTGSSSICCQISSGMEPVFKPIYKRRKKVNPNDKNVNIVFKDAMGDYWEEYLVIHNKFMLYCEIIHNIDKDTLLKMSELELMKLVEQSPYYKCDANNIDYFKKLEIHEILQNYICHSISNTYALPENISIETVDKLYREAWKKGIKGITVYRENSRAGVLVSTTKKDEKKIETKLIERPVELDCDIIRFQNKGEKWIGFVGLVAGVPYEIFTGKLDSFEIPYYIETGKIKKVKDNGHGSRYDFIYVDKEGYETIKTGLNRVFNREYWNYAKFISLSLRHGSSLPYLMKLIESLKFENDDENAMTSWKKGVQRCLKKYIKDGEKALNQKCPNCGDEHGLVYQDGCVICKSCGWTKC